MSENVNFCLEFVYEFISNHSQVKFIDSFLVSMEYEQVCFCLSNKEPLSLKSFFWGGGPGPWALPPAPSPPSGGYGTKL